MTTANSNTALVPAKNEASIEQNEIRHFAQDLNFYKVFWIFTYGSIIGFVVETFWCFIRLGHFEVRSSMMFAPVNIIYGIGAVVFYLSLRKIDARKTMQIFLIGMVLGTAVELLCSWFQEMAFGTVSWDYSVAPLNIGGRVCLMYSIFWGLLAVIWVKKLYPTIEKLIARIPNRYGKALTYVVLALLVLLAIVSASAVSRWMMRIEGVPANGRISMLIDRLFTNDLMEYMYNNMIIVG